MNFAPAAFKFSRLQSAIGLKLGAEIFGRVVQLGTLALAARLMSQADFGRYALALVIGLLLAQLTDFGLHLAVTRHLSRNSADDYAHRALSLKLLLVATLSLCIYVGATLAGQSFSFIMLIISMLVYSLAEFGFAVLRARSQLVYEAGLVILYRVGLLVGVGVAFITRIGFDGLAVGYMGVTAGVALVTLGLVKIRPVGRFDFNLLRQVAPIGLAIVLSLLAFKIDVPLLQLLTGRAEEVGLYNAAYRLFEPLLLVPAVVMSGMFPGLARAGQVIATDEGRAVFTARLRHILIMLTVCGLGAAMVVSLLAGWFIPLFYGPDYAPATSSLNWLAWAVPFAFVNAGLTYGLMALNREGANVIFFALALLFNLTCNSLLIPSWGRDGAALTTGLTEAALTAMAGLYLLRLLNSPDDAATPTRSPLAKYFTLARANQAGFWALLVLVVSLPFELNQEPLFKVGSFLTVNNLELVYYLAVIVGLATLWLARATVWPQLVNWRKPALWLGLFIAACLVSSGLSVAPKDSFKFTFNVGLGGILWLAVPLWLRDFRAEKLRLLMLFLVGGGAVSAFLGLLEFVPGLKVNDWLLSPFKPGATVAGPFLRLSGTFEYANIAAMYYEMVLPFALAGLTGAVGRLLNDRQTQRIGWGRWSTIALWLVAVGVLWEALILSFSRSAIPGMLVAAPLVFWGANLFRHKRWRPGLGLGFGLGVVLVGLSIVFAPALLLRFTAQSDQGWYRARYDNPPIAALNICQTLTVPVTVHNLTPLDWDGGINGAYRLAYHWLDRPDHIYLFEGIRSQLPDKVKANSSVQVSAQLRAPNEPGSYFLVWDVVQQNVSWFSLKSATFERQPVEVRADSSTCPAPPKTNGNTATSNSTAAPPSVLPDVPPNPERNQLWKIALQMVQSRPFLGVGPDGYRFAYGQYAGLKTWDERIFANSTPLELLADVGIIGTILFVVFVLLTVWPLLKQGFRRSLSLFEVATLAALFAFALHGLLDYFLGFHPIFILLWLLLALAVIVKPLTSKREG